MRYSRIIGCTLVALSLSGCGIYTKYRPVSQVPDNLYGDAYGHMTDTTNIGNLSWRELFTDNYLQILIDSALVHDIQFSFSY